MNYQEVLEIGAAVIASLGGAGAIVLASSSYFGKIWANKLMESDKAKYARDLESLKNDLTNETESYKLKLKKSELIFQKEFEATSEFVALKGSALPNHTQPDMDWHDACDSMAHELEHTESVLRSFLYKHGAVLHAESKKLLNLAIGQAAENKFKMESPEVPSEANTAADNVYKHIEKIESLLLEQVHSQSST
jgi:hypothetical protein